ncbi:MAG: DUF4139 domain-containing protein [Armatimonadota bacterium]|jgi:hypothetical protein
MTQRLVHGFLTALLAAAPILADVDLTTLPERQECHLVIYSAVNLTVVRDRRLIPLAAGPSSIEFAWADTMITRDSVRLRAVDRPDQVSILQATYPPNRTNTLLWDVLAEAASDYLTEASYFTHGLFWRPQYRVVANDDESRLRIVAAFELENHSGEDYENAQLQLVSGDVKYVTELPGGGRGLPRAQEQVAFSHWGYDALGELTNRGVIAGYGGGTFKGDRALNRYEFGQAVGRALQNVDLQREMRADPQLRQKMQRLAGEFGPEVASNVAYMGISEQQIARQGVPVQFEGEDADEEEAAVSLDARARRSVARAPTAGAAPAEAPPPVTPEALGQSYIYEIGGRHEMKDEWRVRFAALESAASPCRVLHKFDPPLYGARVRKFYVVTNDQASGLGTSPLASGEAYVLRTRAAQGLTPVIVSRLPYAAVGAETELDVGFDSLVIAERKRMEYKKTELSFDTYNRVKGWDTEEDFQIEVRNRGEKGITIELHEHQDGEYELTSETDFERVDKNTVKFTLNIPSQETRTIKFHVLKHFGKNAKG